MYATQKHHTHKTFEIVSCQSSGHLLGLSTYYKVKNLKGNYWKLCYLDYEFWTLFKNPVISFLLLSFFW